MTKMKILAWMQNKINGSNGKKKPTSISATYYMLNEPCKQESSDWPQALLAIGTFGNNNLKEDSASKTIPEDSSSFQDFILEEVGTLEDVLNIYLKAEQEGKNTSDVINKNLNSEDSSNLEGKESESVQHGNFYPNKSLVHSRGKDRFLNSTKSKKGVGKKSLSFLLKKIFVCKSGFQPSPFIKDPLTTESRMEKILRAILHKKIYPQGSCSSTSIKKYQLESRQMACSDDDDDDDDDEDGEEKEGEELTITAENGCKWVKTDSEYIVLEI